MMKHHEHTPKSDDYMCKMKQQCMEEWFNSPSGTQYKVKYDQVSADKERLMNEIDGHLHSYMMNKYGVM